MRAIKSRGKSRHLIAWLAAMGSAILFFSCPVQARDTLVDRAVPLFENLGTLHHPITTTEPLAQQYFDQGLRLIYAFNHEEAIRSFEEAARIDPEAAMAYWGIAYALGPNINAPMDRQAERRAYEAIRKAQAKAGNVSARERAYIDALAVRYSIDPAADRKALDRAFADRMRTLSRQAPEDMDAAVLFAEALMNLHPWDYWTEDGQPKPGTQETLEVLEKVLERAPDHTGACHYYIHTVEAWQPERALACAKRLPDLAPGAGHLVHMPSHIYIRLGMYAEAAERNVHAASTDREYLQHTHLEGPYPVGYYPHNIHFLWAALMMQGRQEDTLKAARDLEQVVSLDAVRQVPEMEFFVPTTVLSLARFGKWDAVLQEPAPPSDLRYSKALWHYARGLALLAKGERERARAERAQVEQIAKAMPADRIIGQTPGRQLLQIALSILHAQEAATRGHVDEAVHILSGAVRLQDQVRYNEPPDWYYPVRESLGRLLLVAGKPVEAERVFREDLERTPENPWSLHGLVTSLEAQGKKEAAATVEARFRRAWARADRPFDPSQFEPFLAQPGAAAQS